MVFPSLDGLLCDVPAVVVGRHKLIRHVGSSNFVVIGFVDFVVEHLMLWSDALYLSICCRARRRAKIISPSVWFFIGSTQVDLPSISWVIIW